MIRVVIADDHTLVREGLRALLEKPGDILVVGQAEDGEAAVALARQLVPDVLVLDITMPRLNGIQAVEALQAAGSPTACVIVSMHGDAGLVRLALARGARGYVLKDSVTDDLLSAIRAAARGSTYLSPAVSPVVLAGGAEATPAHGGEAATGALLSPRELEVLQHIGAGDTNRSIAHSLGISVKTVERHRSQLMAKLGVHSVVDLIRVGIQQGLIGLED
jgi:DNA-binding NarL/FixJ family response regulator